MNYKLKHDLPHEATTCLGWLLDARGIEDVEGYVYPSQDYEIDYKLLDHIDDGVQLLYKHLENDNNILIVVDADADGICSASMTWLYIKKLYPEAKLHYICHEHKAHGLEDIIDKVLDENYQLIICPDASSFDFTEHKLLRSNYIDVLVLDHHDAPSYSEDAIVINNQLSTNYSNKGLCGAGVVYKFLQAFDNYLGVNYANDFLDLCALANVADCMSPSNLETRYYISEGLKFEHIKNSAFRALIQAQQFSLSKSSNTEMDYMKVAFYIAPLINALIRVGTMDEKQLLFEAFIKPNEMVQSNKRGAKPGDMVPIGAEMSRIATNARSRQNRIKEKAEELIDYRIHKYDLLEHKILFVEIFEDDKIPQELTGLLATQFVNKYGRPCIIARKNDEGYFRGSLRGNENFEEVPDFAKFLRDSNLMEYVEGRRVARNTFSA